MNKKEKEENVTQIADTVAFEIKHILYQEINELFFLNPFYLLEQLVYYFLWLVIIVFLLDYLHYNLKQY